MHTAIVDRGRSVRTPAIEAPGGAQIMFPLGLLCAGEQAEIASIGANPQSASDCRTLEMGLRVGKTVEMLTNGGGGPLLLKIDESRLAIDRRVAMKILVMRQR